MMAPARRRRAATLVLSAALVAAATSLALVAVRGTAPAGSIQDRTRAVAAGLRCPVCQDLSVADSPSPLARQMRAIIAADLHAGMAPEAIRAVFVRQYGEWILLSPPRRGLNLIAWIAPVLLVVGGLGLAVSAVRRWTRSDAESGPHSSESQEPDLSADDRRLLDRAMRAAEDFE